jgi:hypothetical protein
MPPRKRFLSPARRMLSRISNGWHTGRTSERQDIIPHDPKLLEKLRVSAGDRVFAFASFRGDWAEALSRGCRVTYNDATKIFMEDDTRRADKFHRIKISNAALIPQRKNSFEWSFSFEPYPMLEKGVFGLVAMRSLLNKKGLIVVNGITHGNHYLTGKERMMKKVVSSIAEIYGAGHSVFEREIDAEFNKKYGSLGWEHGVRHPSKISVTHMRTNPVAQEQAAIDLRIMNSIARLEGVRRQGVVHSIEPTTAVLRILQKKLGLKQPVILASIARLDALGQVFMDTAMQWDVLVN